MIANHISTASGHPNHNFETGGIGGTLLVIFAKIFGWITANDFLFELLQAATVAGVGAAASFSVSYILNRKFKKP